MSTPPTAHHSDPPPPATAPTTPPLLPSAALTAEPASALEADRPASATPPRPTTDRQRSHSRNPSTPLPTQRKGGANSLRGSTSAADAFVNSPPLAGGARGSGMERVPSEAAAASTASLGASLGITTGKPPRRGSAAEEKPVEPLNLLRMAAGVVKSRNGSVLSRGFILKSDHRPAPSPDPASARSTLSTPALDGSQPSSAASLLHLRGATNFRAASLGVYGVAQPTETGLRTILNVLRSQPRVGVRGEVVRGERETVWFCSREEACVYIGAQPFVLRDGAQPTRTYAVSDRASNLEGIERRLKEDILRESHKYGGVIQVAEETASGEILSTWVAADSVRTVRELWEQVASEGYNVGYHRVPVTRDQNPEDRYLDSYTELLSRIPTSASLVFNCGLGVVRTTFAMSTALIVRRRQLILAGKADPYSIQPDSNWVVSGLGFSTSSTTSHSAIATPTSPGTPGGSAQRVLQQLSEQSARDRSLLRLMTVLSQSLQGMNQSTVLSLLISQPRLLENLRTALLGNYDIIGQLQSVLDAGLSDKRLVDAVTDECDAMVNLREAVLQHRVRYASLALLDQAGADDHRAKALAALERYAFLLVFSAFVGESDAGFGMSFTEWLKRHPEIAKAIGRMRRANHFQIFSPINDLSAIARQSEGGELAHQPGSAGGATRADVQRSGGELVGDEWARQIVRNRSGIILRTGTILKSDQWHDAEGQHDSIRGTINFRKVPDSSLYGLSQPTQDGISRVLEAVHADMDQAKNGRVLWLNLREEPILYVHGTPYVLRQEAVSLRNVKSYAGISASRLELLEDRLKSDVLNELRAFEGRLLLHTETPDGGVVPIWVQVDDPATAIKTLREIMDETAASVDGFAYRRIPITAEKSPDFSDVKDIVESVAQLEVTDSVVVNCQLGRGRSTRAQVIITLVHRFMQGGGHGIVAPTATSAQGGPAPASARASFTIINNLLRTLRSGQEVKNAVDTAISACGHPFDLLDAIEASRQKAVEAGHEASSEAEGEREVKKWIQKGMKDLRSYFFLILFASWLHETRAETWRELVDEASYEGYVKQRPVFKTIEKELDEPSLDALVPLERERKGAEAGSDEVQEFVAKRAGRILSAFTLLKSDYFSGLQKLSLPERVEGSPNFRRVPMLFGEQLTVGATQTDEGGPLVYGTGMPTVEGLRRALERMGAREKLIYWTSMREEPVIYVAGGRPHVLRLITAPLENVVTTGVTSAVVEGMEVALKADLVKEAQQNGGKVLLHDEIAEPDGTFTVTAMWEDVHPEEILTPKEVFEQLKAEGFRLSYQRLPITDEQAPIPATYTLIEARVSSALQEAGGVFRHVSWVFNCQMGRGRTTSGMIAAALVANILFSPLPAEQLTNPVGPQTALDDDVDLEWETHAWDGREAEPYLAGEYKVILQLVGVLQFGKAAKRLTDRAIDSMEAVQNLRRAVYDFKLRAEAAPAGTKKHRKIFEVALNYLYRLATLYIFSNYLLEKKVAVERGETGAGEWRFQDWMEGKREITHVLSRRTLE